MKDYGFDYMNYITNIPNSMNYNQFTKENTNTTVKNQNMSAMLQGMSQNQQTIDPTKGWIRGNIFSYLYEPYKNYKPVNIEPKNEKEALLFQIMQYKFALVDLNLYLDTHPNDSEMIKLYTQYQSIEKQACDKYESMYGPLTLDSNYLDKNTWTWKSNPWPWEVM